MTVSRRDGGGGGGVLVVSLRPDGAPQGLWRYVCCQRRPLLTSCRYLGGELSPTVRKKQFCRCTIVTSLCATFIRCAMSPP